MAGSSGAGRAVGERDGIEATVTGADDDETQQLRSAGMIAEWITQCDSAAWMDYSQTDPIGAANATQVHWRVADIPSKPPISDSCFSWLASLSSVHLRHFIGFDSGRIPVWPRFLNLGTRSAEDLAEPG